MGHYTLGATQGLRKGPQLLQILPKYQGDQRIDLHDSKATRKPFGSNKHHTILHVLFRAYLGDKWFDFHNAKTIWKPFGRWSTLTLLTWPFYHRTKQGPQKVTKLAQNISQGLAGRLFWFESHKNPPIAICVYWLGYLYPRNNIRATKGQKSGRTVSGILMGRFSWFESHMKVHWLCRSFFFWTSQILKIEQINVPDP